MTDSYPNVLLSIHPEKAEAILDGAKGWEFRRIPPACETPFRLLLYQTAPVYASTGEVWCRRILSGAPEFIAGATSGQTVESEAEIVEYFEGCDLAHALRLTGAKRHDRRVPRSSFESMGRPPVQNFRYLPDVPFDGTTPFVASSDRKWREYAYLTKAYWPQAIPEMGPKRRYGPYPWGVPDDPEFVDGYQWSHPDAASVGDIYFGDVCPMCGVPLRGDEEVKTRDGERGELWEVSPHEDPVPTYHPPCWSKRQAEIHGTKNAGLEQFV